MRRSGGWAGGAGGRCGVALACVLLLAAPAAGRQAAGSAEPGAGVRNGAAAGYVAHRVWDARAGEFTDFEALAAAAAGAEFVLFGEQHDDTPTHRLQLALLERIARRGTAPTLSLEMFERDVQAALDAYLAGKLPEAEFLATARPWPNHAEHYHPLVAWARTAERPVVAANVPRAIANQVAREGLAALDALPAGERAWVAAEIECPEDDYRARFLEVMGRHPMGPPLPPAEEAARAERYYFAQCVKDETMAEAVVSAHEGSGVVVHMTGAFHSDYAAGTTQRVARRVPGARVLTISAVPVPDLDAIDTAAHAGRADYLLFTERAR